MSLKVNIKKDFGSFTLNVNFASNGGITSFLGASGSGKSITLKCIAGIIKPDEGYIELNGRVLFDSENKINLAPQKRNVGYFFQDYALFPNMSVKKNILMGLKKYGKDYSSEEEYKKIAKLLHIEELEDHYPNQLSGGQKQRVALARILVNKPELVLLDEPFSALDEHLRVRLQLEMHEILSSLHQETIFVTHSRDEAYVLSENTMIIDHGNIVETNSTKELFKNPKYLRSAIISGCKNYTECVVKDNRVYIPVWGISLAMKNIPDDIKYVGIRAHAFTSEKTKEMFDIEIIDVMEQPFEKLMRFKFKNQLDKNYLYWELNKDVDVSKVKRIGINNEDILLLK